jgi:hypothetical protein
LQRVDGDLLAAGDGYKARFGPDGVEFTAVQGARVPRSQALSWSLESIGRTSAGAPEFALSAASTASVASAPQQEGLSTIVYERAPGIEERYEVRSAGIEWTIGLAAKPQGTGDLELVYRASELPQLAPVGTHEALRFGLPCGGSISISTAWAIDQAGVRTPVEVRYEPGVIALRMPASSVDAAVFPLLIDPLVSANSENLAGPGSHSSEPRIAWSASLELGLVVWQEAISAADSDIRGQLVRVAASGEVLEPIGSLITIQGSSALETAPDVVWGVEANAFLVVNERRQSPIEDADVHGRAVQVAFPDLVNAQGQPGSGALLSGIPEPNPLDPGDELSPSLGGRMAGVPQHTRVVLGYEQFGDGLRGAIVEFSGTQAPTLFAAPQSLSVAEFDQAPRFSRGSDSTMLLCWQRYDSATTSHAVQALLLGFDGTTITAGPEQRIDTPTPSSIDDTAPQADGDGTEFVVAFARGDAGARDIAVTRLRRSGPGLLTFEQLSKQVDLAAGTDEQDPALIWNGREYQLAWTGAPALGDVSVHARTLDPLQCLTCQSAAPAGFGTAAGFVRENPSGAAIGNSGTSPEDGVCVWQSRALDGSNSEIYATLLQGESSVLTDLGGGCSLVAFSGGTAAATHCLSPGAAAPGEFRIVHRVLGAAPTAKAFLLISLSNNALSLCSGCTLHPDFFSAFVLPADESESEIDANGRASSTIKVSAANPTAVTYVAQWVVLTTNGTCSGLRTSNALSIDVNAP